MLTLHQLAIDWDGPRWNKHKPGRCTKFVKLQNWKLTHKVMNLRDYSKQQVRETGWMAYSKNFLSEEIKMICVLPTYARHKFFTSYTLWKVLKTLSYNRNEMDVHRLMAPTSLTPSKCMERHERLCYKEGTTSTKTAQQIVHICHLMNFQNTLITIKNKMEHQIYDVATYCKL